MRERLFCFGYESPLEWIQNAKDGTDFESSNGVWINSPNDAEAIKKGVKWVNDWVNRIFKDAHVKGYPGWSELKYAYWIEKRPLERWSGLALESFERI